MIISLENELFGHEKGAFTDAIRDRKGYIELATKGTLFIDEISEMSPGMQQKLLRVLEEKIVWRVGSEKTIPIDTRFIFASNKNIEELVKVKKFREDLFYRINTIVITLPPLRDRKEDIPLLVKYFLKRIDEKKEMTDGALNLLMAYNWNGNVRELENEIKRIGTLYPKADLISESMLSETTRNYLPKTSVQGQMRLTLNEIKRQASDDIEKKMIIEELKKSNGNITQAARRLSCRRSSLQRKIKRLKIETPAENVTKK